MNHTPKIVILFFLLLITSFARAIVIDPDDFAAGTDLSTVSPFVKFSTSGGASVFSSSIDQLGRTAANGNDTGVLGTSVFSTNPDENSEWFYWPDLNPDDPLGLQVTFLAPVSSFSLVAAELFQDAGCCVDDPVFIYLFDPLNVFLDKICVDCLIPLEYLGDATDPSGAWPVWQFEYTGAHIGKFIIGGESEPTTIDRLEFTVASVTEPNSLALLSGALLILAFRFVFSGVIVFLRSGLRIKYEV